jgi:hypothetical protein
MLRAGMLVLLATLIVAYVTSYLVLSRRGFAEAHNVDSEGFHYLPLENTDSWRRNERALRLLFLPMNLIDQGLGTGLSHASEPLWDLS